MEFHTPARWRAAGKDPGDTHVKVGLRFCCIAYHMIAGRQVFRHPGLQQRGYILDKLLKFHQEQDTPMPQTLADLHAALSHVPEKEHAAGTRIHGLYFLNVGRRP